MLKKNNRLKKRYQFNYVYKKGEHFGGRYVVLYTTPSKTKDIKVGFAVTKKIGHAYLRNLVRRRLREIVYIQIPLLKQNYNIILVAKEGIENVPFETIKKEVIYLLQKAQMFNEENI
jgi:ribonuclease P protein component